MRHTRRLLLVLVLLGSALLGAPPARPLLWRASKPGKDAPILYLLGSLHIGRPDFYPVHPKVADAYAVADTCVFEIDLAKASSAWQVTKVMLRGRIVGGKTLQDMVSEKTWTELETCAAQVGLPMLVLKPMKPWFCAQMLLAAAVLKAGYDAETGTDHYFSKLARKERKHTAALETVDQQMGIIEQALEPMGEQVLVETIKELGDLDKSLGKLVRCWRAGDVKGLEALLQEMEVGDEKVHKLLLLDRNQKWIPLLEKLVVTPLPPPKAKVEPTAEGTAVEAPAPLPPTGPRRLFVVVGAGHLVGKGSVVDLLRQHGWTVERQ